MAWTLEIHHIDINQGDATLIVAREVPPLIGLAPIVRAVLVDGGRADAAADVHNYITLTANVAAVNVIVVTHYDADHVNGIMELLNYGVTYDNALIFDQGWPGAGGLDNNYVNYLRAINGFDNNGLAPPFILGGPPPRFRITNRVQSYALGHLFIGGAIPAAGTASVPAGAPGTINQAANWLVGDEIMWTNNAGVHNNALYGGALVPAAGAVGGPPLMRCIAANEHILMANGNIVYRPSGLNDNSARGRNARSLAFMVQFENFRYYVGGDISSVQEDNSPFGATGVGAYLAAQGAIHAMKTSHHGAGESTSAAFIGQLNPVAAFISCGFNNGFGGNPMNGAGEGPWPQGHPQQRVLDDLEAHITVDNYYLTNDRGQDDFCRRLKQGVGAWPMAYTPKGVVAGGWGAPNPSAGPANPSPCGGWWPNDGAAGVIRGNSRIDVAAGGTPAFDVTFSRPAIIQPVLVAPLPLPANTLWPNGVALPINTVLPAGALWPGGVNAPLPGLALALAHTLAINLPWPDGQFVTAGAVAPGAYDISGFGFPAATVLPANVVWGNNVQLPVGTIFPAGSDIAIGIISPTPPGFEDAEVIMVDTVLPAGVIWPNAIPLPPGTTLPAFTVFPALSSWPAGAPMPQYGMPNGSHLPNGLQLPQGLIFPAGAQWPANTAMPQLTLPAGVAWPNGQVLPTNTLLPVGAQIPVGIQWPPGVALPGAGTVNQVVNH